MSGAWAAKAVVGLGNPDRTDDGVGVRVVEGLKAWADAEVFTAVKTGLDLAMAVLPYKKVLVVDAAPAVPVGEVALFRLSQSASVRGFPHGMSFAQALDWLKALGLRVPEVWILAIGIPAEPEFGRGLSPEVAAALPKAQKVVEKWLRS